MFSVYVLQSEKTGKYYIGYTSNIQQRLSEHNAGKTKSTRPYRPWSLVYYRDSSSKRAARQIELKIKKMKSRIFIDKLIANQIDETFFNVN